MLGTLEDGRISLEELSRFSNTLIRDGDAMYWNIPALLDGIREVWPGRVRLARRSPAWCRCVGVDYASRRGR